MQFMWTFFISHKHLISTATTSAPTPSPLSTSHPCSFCYQCSLVTNATMLLPRIESSLCYNFLLSLLIYQPTCAKKQQDVQQRLLSILRSGIFSNAAFMYGSLCSLLRRLCTILKWSVSLKKTFLHRGHSLLALFPA